MAGRAERVLRAGGGPPEDGGKAVVDIVGVFPEAFTTLCLLAFVPPVVKSTYLAIDPLVSYWWGRGPKIVVFLPLVFIALSHAIHRVSQGPRKSAIALALIGSSLALGVQANLIAVNALQLSSSFAAKDCEFWTRKHELEAAWQSAHEFRAACNGAVGGEYLIQHCPGYGEQAAENPGWSFLWSMEVRYACAGWCGLKAPLWTLPGARDSCSTVVSQVLAAKVQRDSMQICIYCIVVLALSAVKLIALGPKSRHRRIEQ
mmetsp:Transcript_82840/g.268061  ORF Transcript_82840/g.268061 Transcript_82840/m.268061 type:complete len:259 (+) Transcript_82840:116-892(+)